MFKKTLLISIIVTALSMSSIANTKTYSKEDHNTLVKLFSEHLVGDKKITLNLGNSNETSQIVIKNGACGDYMKILVPGLDAIQSPELPEESKMVMERVVQTTIRQMKKMGCK